ncbi:hypothetical protein GCM10009846_07170 [Agrococcus versicolor]|uniref:DUF4383 domain-containing protein n=1 Tax=Agrococcus versicolor TaxID=501482 RepID=A0ABP5MB10_9MICO
MQRKVALILGIVVGALGLVGLLQEGHLLGLMNVDIALDVTRILLAVVLIAASFRERAARAALVIVGVLYVGMGIIALPDPQLLGMLPSGFTGFDIGFHLIVGVLAIVIGAIPARSRRTIHRA